MARRKSTPQVEPASPTEARQWLLNADLPDGVSVSPRGRISKAAQEFFTQQTGRPIVAPVAA